MKNSKRRWSEEEINNLKSMVDTLSYDEIASELDRTKSSIYNKCFELGINKSKVNGYYSQEEDDKLCNLFSEGLSYDEIANELGRTYYSVKRRHRRMRDGCSDHKRRKWSDKEKKIIKRFFGKISISKIASVLDRSVSSIRNKANKIGVDRSYYSDHSYNKDCFSEINNEICYWSGIIASDGCLTGRNGNILSLTLHKKDLNHILKFKRFLGLKSKIRKRNIDGDYYYSVRIMLDMKSKHFLRDNFSITKRKSLTLQPPNINKKEHVLSYIAGYIDGDGSIGYRRVFASKSLSVYIYSGSKDLLTWIRKEVLKYFDSSESSRFSDPNICGRGDNCYVFTFTGKRCVDFFNYVKSLNLPLLYRKWENIR